MFCWYFVVVSWNFRKSAARYRKPARSLVGPVAKKSFAIKGAYDPSTKVDLSGVPDLEEPASFKSEVHSGEILEMELPLMFSVRIPGGSLSCI